MKKLSNGTDSSSRKPKSNLRASGVAWFLFVVIIVLAFGGTTLMDENGILKPFR